jgi:hypothetical protein
MNERPPPIGVTDRDRRRCGAVHVTRARNGATAKHGRTGSMADYGTAGNRGPETAAGARHATGVRNVATSRAWPPGSRAAGGSADDSASPTGTTADAERAPNGRGHGRTGSLTSENQSLFRYLALSSGGILLGDHLTGGHRRCGPRTPLQPGKGPPPIGMAA